MNKNDIINQQSNNRIAYIDIAKGILIMLVVVGHITNGDHLVTYGIKAVITTFHMPAFFVITGILTNCEKLQHTSFKTFLIAKAYRLLIPYIFFEITGGLWQMLLMGTDAVNPIGIVSGILTIHCHVGANWFLPTLFLAEIGIYILMNVCSKKSYPLLSIMCFIAAFLLSDITYAVACCRRVFVAISFILLGVSFKALFVKKNIIAMVLAILATIAIAYYNGAVDLATRQFGNPAFYVIGSIVGTYGVICFSQCLVPILGHMFSRIGKSSLIIMGTHQNIQVAFNCYFESTYPIPLQIVVFLTVILYEIATISVYEKHIPFLIGMQYKVIDQKTKKG